MPLLQKTPSVPALERGISVLELIADSNRGLTSSELQRRLRVPRSTLHCILVTLQRRGYLHRYPNSNRYMFGLKLTCMGRTAIERLELREVVRPFLQELMDKINLTCHLGILERNEIVIVEKIEPRGPVRIATWVGKRLDAHCCALGKAILAYLPAGGAIEIARKYGLAKNNANTIHTLRHLQDELTRVQDDGYAFENEEGELGLRCIGAPIFNYRSEVEAAISVSAPTSQLPTSKVVSVSLLLKDAARQISRQLGYTGPS